jgi:hypothetical protein
MTPCYTTSWDLTPSRLRERRRLGQPATHL